MFSVLWDNTVNMAYGRSPFPLGTGYNGSAMTILDIGTYILSQLSSVEEVLTAFDPVRGIKIVAPEFNGNFNPNVGPVFMSRAIQGFLTLHIQVIDVNGTKVRVAHASLKTIV